ncbi:hypothetical protein LOTGIDRAFT_237542 [Lottia gigantea]|uniref:Protein CUSTOS n=1 Tax=Lottia gigantea TaxID=225164 RepID=V4B1D7_LOTGI|nr:hypothetical protein LOTGIDRAFT_237542 [Lottia gigantea]ESP04128.1 hypothetical protein LOTGIDRAFT_237542 [Lottia gigantea]
MLANCEDKSCSSSSDDDEARRLQEAVIGLEHVPKPYPNGSSHSKSDNINFNKKTSKRNNLKTDDTKSNELNTTPEFRFFIAKKLGSYLDSITEFPEDENIKKDAKIPKQDGFRLFSASYGDWLTEDEVEKRSSVKRKKKRKSSSSESGEDERLMEAVIPDDFLKDIVNSVSDHPSSQKDNIDKHGELPSEETDQCKNKKHKKCKHKTKDKEDSSVSHDSQQDLIEKRKHKEKKKKHKSCSE